MIINRRKTIPNQNHKTDAGKPPAAHLLEFPAALEQMIRVSETGAAKYGRNTWRRVERDRYLHALLRHVLAIGVDGRARDVDTGLPHLAHVLWNAAALLQLDAENQEDCAKD